MFAHHNQKSMNCLVLVLIVMAAELNLDWVIKVIIIIELGVILIVINQEFTIIIIVVIIILLDLIFWANFINF
jgi:hypothetical protein